ncbi:MAG: helix-turn-helix domain-containing protein [Gemmatimonadales bacterium]
MGGRRPHRPGSRGPKRLLLGTEHSAERIARDLGFRDPPYFGRFFRRETGLTPARFRRRAAG